MQLRIAHPVKNPSPRPVKKGGAGITFSEIKKLKEFITRRPTQKEVLKQVSEAEGKTRSMGLGQERRGGQSPAKLPPATQSSSKENRPTKGQNSARCAGDPRRSNTAGAGGTYLRLRSPFSPTRGPAEAARWPHCPVPNQAHSAPCAPTAPTKKSTHGQPRRCHGITACTPLTTTKSQKRIKNRSDERESKSMR